jgi:hypothetical protein
MLRRAVAVELEVTKELNKGEKPPQYGGRDQMLFKAPI